MGLSYEILYKRGSDNVVADALSRRDEKEAECAAITTVILAWIQELTERCQGDTFAEEKIQSLMINTKQANRNRFN